MALTNDTAIIFVLNWKYLKPLRVLLYSLYEQKSLQGCDIVVVTDDRKVERDPFVRAVATTIEFYGDDDLKVFSTIRGDILKEHQKVAFAPKYTFFKFVGFKPRGYARHIVMDADMLCLNALDEELLAGPHLAKAMFEVRSSQFPIRDEDTRGRLEKTSVLEYLEERSLAIEPKTIEVINSGFMVLQGAAIRDDVFADAIRIASETAFSGEQAATTEVLRGVGQFQRLPMWYNTRRRVFESLGEELFEQYRDRVRLFHYTPGKPWIRKEHEWDFLDRVWLDCEKRGAEWIADTASRAGK